MEDKKSPAVIDRKFRVPAGVQPIRVDVTDDLSTLSVLITVGGHPFHLTPAAARAFALAVRKSAVRVAAARKGRKAGVGSTIQFSTPGGDNGSNTPNSGPSPEG